VKRFDVLAEFGNTLLQIVNGVPRLEDDAVDGDDAVVRKLTD
jgi:hypothetical protein